jgi:hypothetical protein
MTVGLVKASVFAIKKESTSGTYAPPSTGADFIPLRPGNELAYEPEALTSDEIVNDIGATKSATGKEVVSGKHSSYLKHSGVEGQETEVGALYESLFGSKYVAATEYDTVSSSTESIIKVGTGEGVNFRQGQALLVKKADGYKIVNIASISGDNLTVNFNLDSAPGVGVNLGKAVAYLPVAQGHPTFSTTKYIGNGHAVEVSAGNTVTEASFKMGANGFGEVEFSFAGTKYYFNPITIDSSNNLLDAVDDGGAFIVEIAEGIYKTPIALANALEAAFNAASAETYTVSFASASGKFTIATSTSALFSLLWDTGANAPSLIADSIGFSSASDSTGALSYTSPNEQVYSSSITPSYDADNKIIIKGAELFIGNATDNICFCAQSVTLKVAKTVEDVDCICEESGILEKIPTSRSADMDIVAVLKKHDVSLLDSLLKNEGISAMMNAGPKSGGNWIPGKCFNAYLQKCTVSKYTTSGDSFVQVNISLKGYVTSTEKDIYINFV